MKVRNRMGAAMVLGLALGAVAPVRAGLGPGDLAGIDPFASQGSGSGWWQSISDWFGGLYQGLGGAAASARQEVGSWFEPSPAPAPDSYPDLLPASFDPLAPAPGTWTRTPTRPGRSGGGGSRTPTRRSSRPSSDDFEASFGETSGRSEGGLFGQDTAKAPDFYQQEIYWDGSMRPGPEFEKAGLFESELE